MQSPESCVAVPVKSNELPPAALLTQILRFIVTVRISVNKLDILSRILSIGPAKPASS
jgi:hypothetical protein